jgi:hypothetical protein
MAKAKVTPGQREIRQIAHERAKQPEIRWWVGTQPEPEYRLQIVVSAEDAAKQPERGDASVFEVKDKLTGKRVRLRRADCGLGCMCALEIAPGEETAKPKRTYRMEVSASVCFDVQAVSEREAERLAEQAIEDFSNGFSLPSGNGYSEAVLHVSTEDSELHRAGCAYCQYMYDKAQPDGGGQAR